MTASRLRVDIDRVMAELDALAGMSDAPAPAVTRVLYTEDGPCGPRAPQGSLREARA